MKEPEITKETITVHTRRAIPDYYTSPDIEFDAAVNRAVLIDRSDVGRIEVTGADRVDMLHRLSTNDLLAAKPGQMVSTVFTTENGKIIDYVRLLVRSSSLLAITSRTSEQELTSWIDKYCIMENVKLNIVTPYSVMFSFIGPESKSIVETIFDITLTSPQSAVDINYGHSPVSIAWTQDFGIDALDIILPQESATRVWEQLSHECEKRDIPRMGSASYDAFRISRGMPAFGAEISSAFNPYEAGLTHAISFSKGCYIGQEVIARLDTYEKVQRELVGLVFQELHDRAQTGAALVYDSKDVGLLTSVSRTPVHGSYAGLAVVRKNSVPSGQKVQIHDSQGFVEGVVVMPPFDIRGSDRI